MIVDENGFIVAMNRIMNPHEIERNKLKRADKRNITLSYVVKINYGSADIIHLPLEFGGGKRHQVALD